MANLKDVIRLCKNESGRVFILSEAGDLELVIMPARDYAELKGLQIESRVSAPDPEVVNREIEKAQTVDRVIRPQPGPSISTIPSNENDLREEVIDPSFNFDGPDDLG